MMGCKEEHVDACSCNAEYETRHNMLKEIMEYTFSAADIALYCDTHPEDEKAIAMHSDYTNIAKDLSDKYQKVYGPITSDYPDNKWRWLEGPWPWEKGAY